jgi:uncharacterized membrane protein
VKQTNWRDQIISVLSMFALLIAANRFDNWQESLKENAAAMFEGRYLYVRLWSLPVAALLFAICWLILFRFMLKHNHKVTATLFLVVGVCVAVYPSIAISLGILSEMGIPADYFGDTTFFYSSAFVAAMGVVGMLTPAEK